MKEENQTLRSEIAKLKYEKAKEVEISKIQIKALVEERADKGDSKAEVQELRNEVVNLQNLTQTHKDEMENLKRDFGDTKKSSEAQENEIITLKKGFGTLKNDSEAQGNEIVTFKK